MYAHILPLKLCCWMLMCIEAALGASRFPAYLSQDCPSCILYDVELEQDVVSLVLLEL